MFSKCTRMGLVPVCVCVCVGLIVINCCCCCYLYLSIQLFVIVSINQSKEYNNNNNSFQYCLHLFTLKCLSSTKTWPLLISVVSEEKIWNWWWKRFPLLAVLAITECILKLTHSPLHTLNICSKKKLVKQIIGSMQTPTESVGMTALLPTGSFRLFYVTMHLFVYQLEILNINSCMWKVWKMPNFSAKFLGPLLLLLNWVVWGVLKLRISIWMSTSPALFHITCLMICTVL